MPEQTTDEDIVDSSQQTSEQGQSASSVAKDSILDHPDYKELERQKNAAEQDASMWKGRLDKAQKTMKGDEKEEARPADNELDWKLDNHSRLKLVKDEYQQQLSILKAAGAKETDDIRTIALERAEERKGIRNDTSDVERQAANSSAPGTISRTKSNPVQLTEHDKRFGLSADRKKQLEEKYPELKEEI